MESPHPQPPPPNTIKKYRYNPQLHTHSPKSAHHWTGTLGDILLQFEGGCVIGQLLQIITSTEIPSWKRPQNYKVWQLESQRGRENDEDEKNNKLSWSLRAAIWIEACFGLAGTQMLLFPKEPKSNTQSQIMHVLTHIQYAHTQNILINGRLTYSNHSPLPLDSCGNYNIAQEVYKLYVTGSGRDYKILPVP